MGAGARRRRGGWGWRAVVRDELQVERRRVVEGEQQHARRLGVAQVGPREGEDGVGAARVGRVSDDHGAAKRAQRGGGGGERGAVGREDDHLGPLLAAVHLLDEVAQRLLARRLLGGRVEQQPPHRVALDLIDRRREAELVPSQLLLVRGVVGQPAAHSRVAAADVAQLGVDAVALHRGVEVRLRGARALLEIEQRRGALVVAQEDVARAGALLNGVVAGSALVSGVVSGPG